MSKGRILLNLTLFICISILITGVFYFFNVWFLSLPGSWFLSSLYFSPTDGLFFEGFLFLIFGIALLLGAYDSARAELTFGLRTVIIVGPGGATSEDKTARARFALILILAGVIMILVSLYFQYVI